MHTEMTAAILLATLNECRRSGDPLVMAPSRIAKAQAAALAKATEGAITISAEGLPSREVLLARACGFIAGTPERAILTRVAEALPEPVPPLPTAPGSTASRSMGAGEVEWAHLTDDPFSCWVTDSGNTLNERQMRDRGFIVRHDAGAGQ